MKFNQLLYTIPVKSWKQYNKSRRAKQFTKMLINMLIDITIYIIIAGVVLVLEIIDIIEGTNIFSENKFAHAAVPTKKVITTILYMH